MNKKYILLGITVLLIVLAAYYTQKTAADPQPTATTQQTTTTDITPATPPLDASTTLSGRYTPYTPTIIAETTGTKILFFHAPWCPQCRELEASINDSTIPANVTIIKVDYDSNQALRKQYGVTLQTTLVKVDDQGALIEKFVAYDEPNFQSIQQLLNE